MTKKLLVVDNHYHAKILAPVMGDDWMIVPCGHALLGFHFSAIVLAADWDRCCGTAKEWLANVVGTRVVNKGVVVYPPQEKHKETEKPIYKLTSIPATAAVVFTYKNYRNETKTRIAIPVPPPEDRLVYASYKEVCPKTEEQLTDLGEKELAFYEKEQWFIQMFDFNKKARRHFAVERITDWRQATSEDLASTTFGGEPAATLFQPEAK
jgi:hypothetical protein